MLCLKKRRTYSFTQGVCTEVPRRSKEDNRREGALNMAITTLPRKNRTREERPSRMVLTVTEDTPADMLAGSMDLLVQLPRDHHLQTQRVTVQRSTPMMDLLVQIATAHKLAASSYTLQAIGERGMILPHQPNTPIGALDALQVKLLPKQGTFAPRRNKQLSQPFETTFRLQVHLPRNQLYVSRVSPKMNLGEILEEVCREKNLDKSKYELRHPANLETLDLSLSLQDYHLQEVTLYAKQGRTLGSALSTQDIMALQRQEERRRQQAKQGVFGFVFKKSKEGSLSTDSLGGRSASPARSDETGRSTSPLQPPARPQRKRRPAPKPPIQAQAEGTEENSADNSSKDKVVISHSRNSSDSSGYHEASVLSDNPDSAGRLPETLPRRIKAPLEMPRKLAQTSQSSKSLSNLASVPGLRKKRSAPPPPVNRPLSSAISTQALERIIDSEESLTSDMDPSKPPSDLGAPSKANSDIEERQKASSDIGVTTVNSKLPSAIDFTKSDCTTSEMPSPNPKCESELRQRSGSINVKLPSMEPSHSAPVEDDPVDARMSRKRVGEPVPLPKPRTVASTKPEAPKRKLALSTLNKTNSEKVDSLSNPPSHLSSTNGENSCYNDGKSSLRNMDASCKISTRFKNEQEISSDICTSEDCVFLAPELDQGQEMLEHNSIITDKQNKTDSTCTETLNINEDKENIQDSANQNNTPCKIEQEPVPVKENVARAKDVCAVISTIPKCEHLNALSVNYKVAQNKEKEAVKDTRRIKIIRTASKLNDFETNSLERQKRYLTSHAEDITFALNLNVTSNIGLKTAETELNMDKMQQAGVEQRSDSVDIGGRKSDILVGASDTSLSDTDVLLQKVSDTLSNSLPVSPSIEASVSQTKIESESNNTCEEVNSMDKKNVECPDGLIATTSTPNVTVISQQDTSDYVSAVDEDLAVTDWEYQLPAPPSAFRDSSSPVFDNFETVAPSLETFTDSEIQAPVTISKNKRPKNNLESIETQKGEEQEIESKLEGEPLQKKNVKRQKSELNLKKEMINELENKLGTLPHSAKDVEFKRTVNNPSTPKVAPVDNTLSNFTITTYSRQKSLNIFEEVNERSTVKNTDDRFIRSFATLSRNRNNLEEYGSKNVEEVNVGTLQGVKKIVVREDDRCEKKLEPKIHTETLHKWQTGNEKSNIQRSRSYVSVCEKPNTQEKVYEKKNVKENYLETDDGGMKKATSITNLNAAAPKNNEKFSQWRDNILKRQEHPTKEKQLQSLQVLRSILPQLKNAQQVEENMPKESNDTVLPGKSSSETTSNEHSMGSNVVSFRETQIASNETKVGAESKNLNPEMNRKRYTYSGPPMINLGSWSERPSVNVHIKMDTDYKFGTKSSSKSITNINGTKDDVDGTSHAENPVKVDKSKRELSIIERKEPNELAKKLITHTTASGFKKPVLNKINNPEPKINNDKPVITGVELKKSFIENNKQDDNVIDTTPVNFKELAKAFGQEVCLRSKPKRPTSVLESVPNKSNGHADSDQYITNGHQDTLKPKRFTNIIGIQTQSQANICVKNDINVRANQSMPSVERLKASNANGGQNYKNSMKPVNSNISNETPIRMEPPRPPTMPVITGVTLKSARPKSMPVQMDHRDILLESIRNFGGRGNLKSAAEKC